MIQVLAIITTKPGQRDAVLEAFRANRPAVRAEAGCIEYAARPRDLIANRAIHVVESAA